MASWSRLSAFIRVGGFGLSPDEVKGAVGLFYGFVFTMASAPCDFFKLNNEYMIIKKRKEK